MKKFIAWLVVGVLVLGFAGLAAYSFINYKISDKDSVNRISAPETISFNEETMKLSWSKVDGSIGYIVAVNDNTFISTKNSVDLTSKIIIPEEVTEDIVYKIGVSAISGDPGKVNSKFIYADNYIIHAPEVLECEECDHSDCSYVEAVEGVDCDFVCDHSDCSKQERVEAVEGVECDNICDHSECSYDPGVECDFEVIHELTCALALDPEDPCDCDAILVCDHSTCAYIEETPCDNECDHNECSYIEAVAGQDEVDCDAICDHSECSYVEGIEGVECDFVCDHNECSYVEPEEVEGDDLDTSDEE